MKALAIRTSIAALGCGGLLAVAGDAAGAGESSCLPIFPGATARPALARAVEAYYRSGLEPGRELTAAVYETAASFERVYEFYGPQMDEGTWGWRRQAQPLEAHAAALRFMRARARASNGGRVPPVLRPLFGDPALDDEAFAARLERLVRRHRQAKVDIVEGTRTIRDGPMPAQVRLTVERPYLDVERMRLVERTRLVVVRVADRRPGGRP